MTGFVGRWCWVPSGVGSRPRCSTFSVPGSSLGGLRGVNVKHGSSIAGWGSGSTIARGVVDSPGPFDRSRRPVTPDTLPLSTLSPRHASPPFWVLSFREVGVFRSLSVAESTSVSMRSGAGRYRVGRVSRRSWFESGFRVRPKAPGRTGRRRRSPPGHTAGASSGTRRRAGRRRPSQ